MHRDGRGRRNGLPALTKRPRCSFYEYCTDDSESDNPESGDTFYDEGKPLFDDDHKGGYFGYTTKGDTFFMQYKTPRRDSKDMIFTVMEGQRNPFPVIPEEGEEADDEAEEGETSPSQSDSEAVTTESDSDTSVMAINRMSDPKVLAKSSPNTLKRVLIEHNGDPKALMYLPQTFFEKLRKGLKEKLQEPAAALAPTVPTGLSETRRRTHKSRDWNKEFQQRLPDGLFGTRKEDVIALSELGEDFTCCAENYAKLIVDEMGIELSMKTIKPADVGGIAGGEKFIVHGILFKFCLDQQISNGKEPLWMYGGKEPNDDQAMKVAGLELKSLDQWQLMHAKNVHFPLTILIDYKGFRLVATSLLPVNKKTIIYGSNDGGKTVRASDKKFNKIMAEMGTAMNLRPHRVGRKRVMLQSPGDIEGHKGKDGRYYLLDFSRSMPPEAPDFSKDGKPIHPRGVFYRMLRPELVASYPVPLSPDVFSGWGDEDGNKLEHQKDVQEATQSIFTERIPAFVKELEMENDEKLLILCDGNYSDRITYKMINKLLSELRFSLRMHMYGINNRYMGMVRAQMTNPIWRMVILSFAMARVIKYYLRKRLRECLWSNVTSDSVGKRLIADIINCLLDQWKPGETMCKSEKAKHTRALLEEKFAGILTEQEKEMSVSDFQKLFSCRMVLSLLLHLKLVKFTPKISKCIPAVVDLSTFHLVEGDITEVCASVRRSVVLEAYSALAYQLRGKEKIQSNTRLFLREELVPGPTEERELHWRLARVPVGQRIQLTGEEKFNVRVNPFTGPLVERLLQQVCTEAKGKNLDLWEFPKPEHYIDNSISLERESDPSIMLQARRLFKQAEDFMCHGNRSTVSMLGPIIIWGDILKDLAETYSDCTKIEKYYEAAYDKFRFAASIAGPSVLLLFIWAQVLSRHAEVATRFNLVKKAKLLKQSAEDKLADINAIYTLLNSFINEGTDSTTVCAQPSGETAIDAQWL